MSGEPRRMGEAQGPGPTAQQQYRMKLYRDHYEEVWRYIRGRVECPQDAEDLAQEVFLNLMASSGAVRNRRAYVRAVARHKLYAYWQCRRANLHVEQTLSAGEGDCAADSERDWDPLELVVSNGLGAPLRVGAQSRCLAAKPACPSSGAGFSTPAFGHRLK